MPVAFACHGCGHCCRGSTVLLSPFDLARLAVATGLGAKGVMREYGILLKHPQTNLPTLMLETVPQCRFLSESNQCTVYGDRPLVCRSFPLGVVIDLERPGYQDPLSRFSLRSNPCPAPTDPNPPLPVVRTCHSLATDSRMENHAAAQRLWSRLCWDFATLSPDTQLPDDEALAFDREFIRTFFEEVDAPAGEPQALAAFAERVERFRALHQIWRRAPPQAAAAPQ